MILVLGGWEKNRLFEFGAFEDLMLNFKSDGPYLLLNDTFFSNHVSGFWMMLIKQWSKELIKKTGIRKYNIRRCKARWGCA